MPSRGAGSIVHPTLLGCRRPCQTGRVLIDGLAATAERVASTRSRLAKVDALAALLSALEPGEILPAVGFLTAKPRQGRLGVGWRGLTRCDGRAGGLSRRSRSRVHVYSTLFRRESRCSPAERAVSGALHSGLTASGSFGSHAHQDMRYRAGRASVVDVRDVVRLADGRNRRRGQFACTVPRLRTGAPRPILPLREWPQWPATDQHVALRGPSVPNPSVHRLSR